MALTYLKSPERQIAIKYFVMSAATASNIDHYAEDANDKSMPKGPEKGQGGAVRNGLTITPEATPEPEVARNEAEDRRREEEEEQPTNSDSNPTANDQPLNDNDKGGTGDTSGGEGDMIQDILKCGKDEHRKVLGISESYTNLYEEEKAIEEATWKRGTDTHPKYNKGKDAQKAFDSTCASFSFLPSSANFGF